MSPLHDLLVILAKSVTSRVRAEYGKSAGLKVRRNGLRSGSALNNLSELGQAPDPLWASVSPSVAGMNNEVLPSSALLSNYCAPGAPPKLI